MPDRKQDNVEAPWATWSCAQCKRLFKWPYRREPMHCDYCTVQNGPLGLLDLTKPSDSPRDHAIEEKTAFEGGATRSTKLTRYDLIPPEIDEALAQRFGLGASKHGDNNWKNGEVEFIRTCIDHAKGHEGKLIMSGPDQPDDNLAAILWNWGVLAWFRKHKPAAYRAALWADYERRPSS